MNVENILLGGEWVYIAAVISISLVIDVGTNIKGLHDLWVNIDRNLLVKELLLASQLGFLISHGLSCSVGIVGFSGGH